MNEKVILVNQQDEMIGEAEKLNAHQAGLLHRAFSIFVYRLHPKHGLELLLQQRQQNKYHSGGLWTNTCCSHPQPGEPVMHAAIRRLQEEMGLSLKLTFCGKFYYHMAFENGLTEHEWDYVFIGAWRGESIHCNPQEVETYCWTPLQHVIDDVKINPSRYTCWFEKALTFIIEKQSVIIEEIQR